MSAIDIGAAAISRATAFSANYTIIALDNPANLSGIITSVEIWAKTNISGLKVGTFYLVSGTTYKCRDSATLGSVATGAKRTFSGLAINVVAGDFIGCFFGPGTIMENSTGGAGAAYLSGVHMTPGSSFTYTMVSNHVLSLYGAGIVPSVSDASFLLRMI